MSRKEIDLHGLYSEQAEAILEGELRSAYATGITELVVIHGKGTGVLRETVMNTLHYHKDKWVDIIKGENTFEIGDSGFVKVRMKFKDSLAKQKYLPRKTNLTVSKELNEASYKEKIEEKRANGKKKYLKMIKNKVGHK